MNRRQLLQNLLVVSGGLATLPAWADQWCPEDFNSPNGFSLSEQDLLRSVADTFIPGGKDPGAVSVGVDKFLGKLFEECYEKPVQDNIKSNLAELDENAKTKHQSGFSACSQKQREDLLLELSAAGEKNQKDFFSLLKSETIRGYNTSKIVMVEYLKYKVVPGHYHGCVTVKS